MGNWKFKTLLKTRSSLVGAVAGLALGAGVAGAAIAGFAGAETQFDGAKVVRTADLTPAQPPVGAPMSFADLIEQVSPAVVSIETRGKMKMDAGIPGLPPGLGLPPGFTFPGQEDATPREQEVRGAGSGFFISADGYVVTNNHVIEGADEIIVKMTDDKEFKATVVGRDVGTDLAVLKVEGKSFPFVRWELDQKPRVGDWVVAVGNPFNFSNTATAGIVSAYGRDLKDSSSAPDYVDYVQIDAAINRGNSGGPTFDLYGKVIGVNTAIVTPSGANAGVGFAIPADVANTITAQLMKGVSISRGYIGVQIQSLNKDTAEALNITDLTGAYVQETTDGGPAQKAGIDIGDIIKSVNGAAVKSPTDLTRRIADIKAGEKVNLGILRNGKTVMVAVTAALRPSEADLVKGINGADDPETAAPGGTSATDAPVMGLSVKALTPDTRKAFGITDTVKGIVITDMTATSDGAQKGLKAGDVIVRADNRPISKPSEFAAIVAELKKAGRPSILLLINRAGQNVPLPVSLKDPVLK